MTGKIIDVMREFKMNETPKTVIRVGIDGVSNVKPNEIYELKRIASPIKLDKEVEEAFLKAAEKFGVNVKILYSAIMNNPYIRYEYDMETTKWEKANPGMLSKVFALPPNPKHVMFHNGATILEIGNNKIVVKCDNRDTFNPVIGLKNAIYRFYKKWGFRDTDKGHEDSLGKKLSYMEKVFGEYSEEMKDLAFAHLCGYDEKYCVKLVNKLHKYENGKWIDL